MATRRPRRRGLPWSTGRRPAAAGCRTRRCTCCSTASHPVSRCSLVSPTPASSCTSTVYVTTFLRHLCRNSGWTCDFPCSDYYPSNRGIRASLAHTRQKITLLIQNSK
uniref:Uncharacterized protein n=1 Tax=Triticum urartu TaxID=4572 RepID=A0A8R7VEQ3_TRIUA